MWRISRFYHILQKCGDPIIQSLKVCFQLQKRIKMSLSVCQVYILRQAGTHSHTHTLQNTFSLRSVKLQMRFNNPHSQTKRQHIN